MEAGRIAVVRGPTRNAAMPGFAERVLQRLDKSAALKNYLSFLDNPKGDVAIVFCLSSVKSGQPGTSGTRKNNSNTDRRGPPQDPSGPDCVRLLVMRCTLKNGNSIADAFADKSKRELRSCCIAPIDLNRH